LGTEPYLRRVVLRRDIGRVQIFGILLLDRIGQAIRRAGRPGKDEQAEQDDKGIARAACH
jgi:hypothetical protein